MNKRELILDSLQTLIIKGKGAACSVSDIAKQAGIGKGSIYYYFKSKEEIVNALIDRYYSEIIVNCKKTIDECELNAVLKMQILFKTYYSFNREVNTHEYLHEKENAYIHQKSMVEILKQMSPILADVIKAGVEEKIFICDYPDEFAEIIISELCFVLDNGIFDWNKEEIIRKRRALSNFLEKGLSAPKGSFAFLE